MSSPDERTLAFMALWPNSMGESPGAPLLTSAVRLLASLQCRLIQLSKIARLAVT